MGLIICALCAELKVGDGFPLLVKLRERPGEVRKKPKKKPSDTKGKKPGPTTASPPQEESNEMPIDSFIVEVIQMKLGALGLQPNRNLSVPVSASQQTSMIGSVANAIGIGMGSSSPAAQIASSNTTPDKKKNSKSASSEVHFLFHFLCAKKNAYVAMTYDRHSTRLRLIMHIILLEFLQVMATSIVFMIFLNMVTT